MAEPTNHLDIPAQEVLEDAIREYPGGVVLVSHDRALIDAVATRVWAIEDGTVREVLGNYSDLEGLRLRGGTPAAPSPAPRAAPAAEPARAAGQRKDAKDAGAVRRERAKGREHGASVRRLEQEIARVEAELAQTRERLLDPASFADPDRGAELGRQHDRLEGALADLYERWAGSA